MNKIKKLRTFGGVFVPSLLTILGVILYMRLPWIVGNAGLYATLGIILVAHIISVTTGLSISSIATDKKVETGGTYFMISRSLGLPIGGTLGLALFVGLSFSTSLYLIGFSEAFLSFFGMDNSLNSIRLTGLIVLSTVTLITFISTKLAIKTQYLILTAMILSLLSIFFGNHDLKPSPAFLQNPVQTIPWIVLFGIFFPAVTGFEAGVSMSGDLENPKKSIPRGTIMSIFLGLIVYIGISIFLSLTVSSEQLRNNPNVLFDISLIKQLVITGVFGATLSSALGSILAAPRILQAISIDKITPKFFAKGYGDMNEPRHALLFTFLIALSGIMIGELNVIARIVTIFFIITYGFLNLSCFIENWSSSDFRPTFRIHPIISIIGFVACFVVMIQLDFLAMIIASAVLISMFFYLKRKELVLSSGDAWDGVWASLVKSGLSYLKRSPINTRNWRPNIILFSGGNKSRPYLIEIGSNLIGKQGLLTDFELIEDSKKNEDSGRIQNAEDQSYKDLSAHIFRKQYHCSNIYKGIESITQLYGFSGVEPNTVLLGFPNDESKIDEFINICKIFEKNNYNNIFIKYNKEKYFGQKKNIDIWWDGESNNLVFAIILLRFLTSGFTWRHAKCRLNLVNNFNIPEEDILKKVKNILNSFRFDLEIKVHNNAVEDKPIFDLMTKESISADLIVYEVPAANSNNISKALKDLQKQTSELPTMMLLKASDVFESGSIFRKKLKIDAKNYDLINESITKAECIDFPLTEDDELNKHIIIAKEQIEIILNNFYKDFFVKIHERNVFISNELQKIIDNAFKNINKNILIQDNNLRKDDYYRIWEDMLIRIKELSNEIIESYLQLDKMLTDKALKVLLDELDNFNRKIPKYTYLTFNKNQYASLKNDSIRTKTYKFFKRMQCHLNAGKKTERIRFRDSIQHNLQQKLLSHINILLVRYQDNSYFSVLELRKIIEQLKNLFYKIEVDIHNGVADNLVYTSYKNEIAQSILENDKNLELGIIFFKRSIFSALRREMKDLTEAMGQIHFRKYFQKNKARSKHETILLFHLNTFADVWFHNTTSHARQLYVEILVQLLTVRLKSKIFNPYNQFLNTINKQNGDKLLQIKRKIKFYIDEIIARDSLEYDLDAIMFNEIQLIDLFEDLFESLKPLTNDFNGDFFIAKPKFDDTLKSKYIKAIQTFELPLRKQIDYVVDGQFYENIIQLLSALNIELNQKLSKWNNLLNLSRYNLENVYISDHKESDERTNKILFLNELQKNLQKEVNSFEELTNNFCPNLSKTLKDTFDPITINYLYNESLSKKSSLRKMGKVQFRRILPLKWAGNLIRKLMEVLLYGRSKGIILAQNMKSDYKEHKSAIYRLLNFAENNSPNNKVMDKLPFYYKNLFNNKFSVNQLLWVGRKHELEKAQKAVMQFRNGSKGAIMVLGERNSGKTSLSNFIAQNHFNRENIFHLYPLREGSAEVNDFEKALSKATGQIGNAHEIMQQIPKDAVIIINDMALWWERSINGMVVIKLIMDLIFEFGHKCLFIINSNDTSYTFMNKLLYMNNHFLVVIKCKHFTTHEIRDLILKRHQSSELRLKYGKLPESLMIEWRYAHLFNHYFNYSDGIIGTALNGWLTNISSVNDKEIIIQKPKLPDLKAFEMLPDEALNVLIQLVLHRRLNKKRLLKILFISEHSMDEILNFLISTKLIIRLLNDIYMLNAFVEPHFVKYLKNKEVI
ncbi:MAG: amino acid permease [Bacteroidales bacterium]|nr:amino acid permease [Bacteroidales bacterium]